MSLNLNTDLVLINTTNNSGSITLPSASSIPGKVITFKDSIGNFIKNNFTLVCAGSDTFEDGTTSKLFNESFGFIQLVASGTKWYILCGVKQNTMTLSSLNVSSISTYTIQFRDGSIQTISADKNINSSIIGLGTFGYISSFNTISSLNISSGNIIANQAFINSTITSNIVVSIDPRSTINVGNSLIPAYSTNRISTISLGNFTNRFFQGFFVSTITSSMNADLVATATLSTTNIIGFNLLGTTILSTQQIFCSSIQIGATDSILDILGPLRTQDMSTVTCQASTITSGTMTLDRLFGGNILASATTTQNLYPFNAGSQLGFYGGSGTNSGGFYNNINVRSTNTQVITPDIQGQFSNVIFMRGNISSQNINVSSLNATIISTITTITTNIQGVGGGASYTSGNIYPQGINVLGFGGGSANGAWDAISVRQTLTSSIITNNISTGVLTVSSFTINSLAANSISTANFFVSTFNINTVSAGLINVSSFNINTLSAGILSVSTINYNNITSGTGFISSLNVNALIFGSGTGYADFTALRAGIVSSIQADTGALKASSINLKLPPFWSTLSIPASSFSITGSSAANPIVLYSNVAFPPYTRGMYKIYQKAILTKLTGGAGLDARGSIFYSQGTFPSTLLFQDGQSALPYVNANNISSYTTCITTVLISSITTRNICYFDQGASAYTASLFMGNLAVEYIPSLGFSSDFS